MTPEEALQLLANVARQYRGTFQDHHKIQEAVKVLAEIIKVKKSKR